MGRPKKQKQTLASTDTEVNTGAPSAEFPPIAAEHKAEIITINEKAKEPKKEPDNKVSMKRGDTEIPVIDFFNHTPTEIRGDGVNLHLIRRNHRIFWFSYAMVQIVLRDPGVEIVTNGESPRTANSLEFPKYTQMSGIVPQAGCKDCQK